MPDKQMAKYIKDGVDLHKVSAAMAIHKPIEEITKEERQKGKAISFGFVFGMSAKSFVEYAFTNYGVKFSLAEANSIRNKYMNTYKGVATWADYWWKNYKKRPVSTPMGHFSMPKLGTDAINYRVQGSIAELTKMACVKLLTNEDIDFKNYIFNVVHDAIDFRVPRNIDLEATIQEIVKNMLLPWQELCDNYNAFHIKDIPMNIEVSYNLDNGDKVVREFGIFKEENGWTIKEL
jgi:DNA polymerase-1